MLLASLALTETSGQAPILSQLMRQKLEHSHGLLEAIVTSDWQALERHGRDLEAITENQAWRTLMTPRYARQSTTFLAAVQDLIEAAGRRDLETASLAYVSVTLSCVQCHRYVARQRIAKSPAAISPR
jgi:hypothetical protein